MRKIIKCFFVSLFVTVFLSSGVASALNYSGSAISFQQKSYTGKFVMNGGQVTLTLNLMQHPNRQVTGTLKSSNGTVFQVNGTLEEGGVVTGSCKGGGGSVFFEAFLDGDEMSFSLIEPGANGQPDYDKAQYLVFNRAASGNQANGQQVRAKGFGVLSPYGGGAYILAVSTPDKFGNDLVSAAETIVKNMRYSKATASTSGLIRFLADTWITTTTSTSSAVYLYPDGTYSDHYEASYSGNFEDGGGNNTGNWGAGGQQNQRGRWSVKGNKDQGQIIIHSASGEEYVYNYQVHTENGQKYYSEYYFNGTLYHRKNKYD